MNLETGGAARPAAGLPSAGGHDARRADGQTGVTGCYALYAVLHEGDGGADHHELQLGPGSQRPAVVAAAELGPEAPTSLEQHEAGAAVVPAVDADVGVLPAVLHPYRRPDPLAAGELCRGDLYLGILVAGVGLGRPDVTGGPGPGSGHCLGGDRQPAFADIGPVRAEAPVRPIKSIGGARHGRR